LIPLCNVLVLLTVLGAGSHQRDAATAAKRTAIVVGRERVKVKAGHETTIKITLNATGKRLLAKRHTPKVSITITQQQGRTLHKTVVFKAPHAAHKR
jgi:hypothetical protein